MKILQRNQSGLRTALALVIFIFVSGLLLLVLGLINWPDISMDTKVNWLFAIILVFLLLVAMLVVLSLRFWSYQNKTTIVLVFTYGLPLLVVLIIQVMLSWGISADISKNIFGNLLRMTWQVLYYIWQSMLLLFSGLFLFPRVQEKFHFKKNDLITGLLVGLGMGLLGAFFCSVGNNLLAGQAQSQLIQQPPGLLYGIVLFFSLTITPYAVEYFYRVILEPDWRQRFPRFSSVILTAGIFAIVQMRILLIPVAFAAGLVFSMVYRRYGLWVSIAAHALCNLILFIVAWYLVF
jgi:membrane protease YdiL (CAAX protease family)